MRYLATCIAITVGFLIPAALQAAEITKVKGKSALIELKGDAATEGDQFYAINAEGKKKALLSITKVKGDRAIAKITKGKAEVGMTLRAKTGGGSSGGGYKAESTSEPSESSSSSTPKAGGRAYWGALLGFAMDSMTVDVHYPDGTSATANLSGSAFSAKGLFDYRLFPQIWFRGTVGLESFNVAGSSICTESKAAACNANIYYISFDGLGRYVFSDKGSFHPWLGGGFGLLFPASKKSTALDSASISNTTVMMFAGGFDWILQSGSYIPVSLEYGMLPRSDDVTGNWIAIRAGLAWAY